MIKLYCNNCGQELLSPVTVSNLFRINQISVDADAQRAIVYSKELFLHNVDMEFSKEIVCADCGEIELGECFIDNGGERVNLKDCLAIFPKNSDGSVFSRARLVSEEGKDGVIEFLDDHDITYDIHNLLDILEVNDE